MSDWGDADYCYVTTTGRRTGRPHMIEIWFAPSGQTVYILTGRTSDTVRNLLVTPNCQVRVGERTWEATGRVVDHPDEAALARRLLPEKYRDWEDGLAQWAEESLPVAFDLVGDHVSTTGP